MDIDVVTQISIQPKVRDFAPVCNNEAKRVAQRCISAGMNAVWPSPLLPCSCIQARLAWDFALPQAVLTRPTASTISHRVPPY